MHLVIGPCDLESNSIFDQNAKAFSFVSHVIALVCWYKGLFFPKSIFLVLLPATWVRVTSLFVLKNSKAISSVDSPLSIVDISCARIFSHSKHGPHSFFLKTDIFWPIFKYFLIKNERIPSLSTLIKIGDSLWQYFFNSNSCFIDCHLNFSQSLLLFFNLFDNPILFLQKMHIIEEHICSFVSFLKIIIKELSISEKVSIVEEIFHLGLEDFMLDLFIENWPYCFPNLLQFETFLELSFDFLAEILLHTLSDIESVNLL